MRRLFIVVASFALLLVAPFVFVPGGEAAAGPPFVIRVVDHAGKPISNVNVRADNGLTCRTNANGETWWPEKSVRRPGVEFHLQSDDVLPARATFDVMGAVTATVTMNRRR
jgi:hypothetical protein